MTQLEVDELVKLRAEHDTLKRLYLASAITGVPRNVCERFNCFDLQRRAAEPAWPKPWRARIRPQKNGRERYRLTAFGDTAAEAIAKLNDMVTEQDIKKSRGDL